MNEFQPYKQPPQHQLGRPQDIDAEAYLLGSVIRRPDLYDEVMGIVSTRDFINGWHRDTWTVISDLIAQDVTIDKAAIVSGVNRYVEHPFGTQEIEAYVEGLLYRTITPSNAKFYATLVAGDAVRRRICEVAPLLPSVANDYLLSVDEARERIAELVFGAMDPQENEAQSAHASDLAADVIDEILQDAEAGRRKSGALSGLTDLDYVLSGLNEGEVILIAARTSVGKSALALRIAESFCKRGDKVVYFSLEMSKKSLMERLLSMHTRIPLSLLRNRVLSPLHRELVKNAKDVIGEWDLQIDEKVAITPQYVRSRSRAYSRRRAIDLIVVDHMHIMQPTYRTGDDVKDLGAVAMDLHNIARDLNIPVLALAQLNRGPENRPDPVPTMRDLRGSGGIEENVDVILGLHRPDYRKIRDNGYVLPEVEQAEVHILKNRNGPAGGMVAVTYKSDCVRFDNCVSVQDVPTAPTTPAQPQAQTTAQPVISTASTTVIDDEDPWADEEPGQINIDRWMEARG